jgi:ATP-binding cassette subfamily B protein
VIATGVARDIRRESFAKLQTLSFSYFDNNAVGWLIARLTSDCNRLSHIMGWALLDLVWGTSMVIGITAVLLYLDWATGLVVLAVFPVLMIVSFIFQRKILVASRLMRKTNSEITAEFNESIAGMKTTKTLVREDENLEEFMDQSRVMYRASMRNALLIAVYFPLVMVFVGAGEGGAVAVGGGRTLGGAIGLVGTFFIFMQIAKMLPDPVREISRVTTEILGAQAAAERIQNLLDERPEIADGPEVRAASANHAADIDAGRVRIGQAVDGMADSIRQVEFREVSFAYGDGPRVLEDFNLTVSAGQTIALVGPTGGGKSTIVALLCRFYEPTHGQVLLDGVDYRRRSLDWYQSQLGIVLQQPHLFSGSVRDNIRYGRLEAGDEEVEHAARLVGAHAFIVGLDDGYDTEVGQHGSNLSTGQRQLVSFARAVLADPQIFVMDEATSSVDTETEQTIQRGLRHVLAGRINFIIAHRLSTIRSADRILVIDGGRVIESGDHHALLVQRGKYFDLYTNQFTRERADELLRGDE